MLRTAKNNMEKPEPAAMLMVQKGTANGKGKGKKRVVHKTGAKTDSKKAMKPKGGIAKEGDCHYCGKADMHT